MTSTGDSFLQSYEWEEIQNCYGRKTTRLSAGGRDILCVKNDLRFGMYYWYSPRPYIPDLNQFFEAAAPLMKEGLFFRIEPLNELRIAGHEAKIAVHGLKFIIHEARNLQPRETILMDLRKSEYELLSAMHPKTRYNIRVAERHGVIVGARTGDGAIEKFYELLAKTAKRDNFFLHPKKYYDCLLFPNSRELGNKVFFAAHGGEIAAAAMVNFHRGVATYLHGASDYEFRSTMASYALHWEIIKEAKARGCHTYDFGGIDEARWPGVSRFKKSFGGKTYAFPHAFDAVASPPKYFFYKCGQLLTDYLKSIKL